MEIGLPKADLFVKSKSKRIDIWLRRIYWLIFQRQHAPIWYRHNAMYSLLCAIEIAPKNKWYVPEWMVNE